jgi:hypothetical protein
METWLNHSPPQAGFTCPHWYESLYLSTWHDTDKSEQP